MNHFRFALRKKKKYCNALSLLCVANSVAARLARDYSFKNIAILCQQNYNIPW